MRGEALDAATLGWHGLEGDRRFAFRRLDARGGFPWLNASKLPQLLCFTPVREGGNGETLPTHALTPEGEAMPLFGEALAADLARRHGAPVQIMHLKDGIFDDASLSVITSTTIGEISRLAETPADARRFRPNVVVQSTRAVPFEEEAWLGGVLTFGDGHDAPAVAVTTPDLRCVMVNLDPDDARSTPGVLKAVARANRSNAGIYATITRPGRLAIGQPIFLHASRVSA